MIKNGNFQKTFLILIIGGFMTLFFSGNTQLLMENSVFGKENVATNHNSLDLSAQNEKKRLSDAIQQTVHIETEYEIFSDFEISIFSYDSNWVFGAYGFSISDDGFNTPISALYLGKQEFSEWTIGLQHTELFQTLMKESPTEFMDPKLKSFFISSSNLDFVQTVLFKKNNTLPRTST